VKFAFVCSDRGVPVCGNKGASIHVRELTRSLQRLGHDVMVLAARTGGDPPPDYEVPIVAPEPESLDDILVAALRTDPSAKAAAGDIRSILAAVSVRHRALPILRSIGPDLIYERYALFGTAGVALARELGVPLILEVNAPLSQEQDRYRGLAYRETALELERKVIRSADHVLAVSSGVATWLLEAGVARDRVTVLPNAVDPIRFQAGREEREAVRTGLGLADEPVVGFLGTLKPWHDVATLVRAVGLLRRRTPAVHLLVVGDGPERERLEELARTERIASATTFAGAVPHAGVPAYVAAFDVGVVPYGQEPGSYFSPLKLFEYLAAGLPVVAADVGDIAHCIRERETGLLYPPGDAMALAGAIESLVADPAWARSMARAGREHVIAHHTWEGNARLVAELADHLVGQEPAGVRA
jgi:glycosyltransferase involved in cell wall biosynthesis